MQPLVDNGWAREDAIEVALLRKSGRREQARGSVQKWLAADPADNALREENVELGGSDPSLGEHLGADPERTLAVADLYLDLGFSTPPWRCLRAMIRPRPPTSTSRAGRPPRGMHCWVTIVPGVRGSSGRHPSPVRADDADVRFVFPWRASSQPVLAEAVAHDSGDGLAHYLLGMWDLNWQFPDAAIRELEIARDLHVNAPALGPTLAAAVARFGRDLPAKAAPVRVARAIIASPESGSSAAAAQRAHGGRLIAGGDRVRCHGDGGRRPGG